MNSTSTTVYVCPSRHHNNTRQEGLTEQDIRFFFDEEELGTVIRATRLSSDEGEMRAGGCRSLMKHEDMWEVETTADPREQGSIYNIPYSMQLPSDQAGSSISIFELTDEQTAIEAY